MQVTKAGKLPAFFVPCVSNYSPPAGQTVKKDMVQTKPDLKMPSKFNNMGKAEIQNNLITENFISDIKTIIEQGRQQAYATANRIAVLTYWHIGQRIVEEELHGEARAQYGTRLIKTLAERLVPKYGSGRRNHPV